MGMVLGAIGDGRKELVEESLRSHSQKIWVLSSRVLEAISAIVWFQDHAALSSP